jgi:hypothetical protein
MRWLPSPCRDRRRAHGLLWVDRLTALAAQPSHPRGKLCGAWPQRTARPYAHPEANAT